MTDNHDSRAVADALAGVRDAVDRCRAVLAEPGRQHVVDLLDTASATSDLTAAILYLVAPLADETEPGTDDALERAADLAADSRRYIVTGMHLMAGAHAIAKAVVSLRQVTARPAQRRVTTPPAQSRWRPDWAAMRSWAAKCWQNLWMPADPDLSRAP